MTAVEPPELSNNHPTYEQDRPLAFPTYAKKSWRREGFMPTTTDDPQVEEVSLLSTEGLLEEDTRRTINELIGLRVSYSKLIENLANIRNADFPEVMNESTRKVAREIAALIEIMAFLDRDPALFASGITRDLLFPIIVKRHDEMTHAQAVRPDGSNKKPATHALLKSMPRGYLAAAADILMKSGMSREETTRWLVTALRKLCPRWSIRAKAVMTWRDETVARMGKRAEGQSADVMITTFNDLRPDRAHAVAKDEAQRLATEWLELVQRQDISLD